MPGTDTDCIRHCLNGQPGAYDQLVRRYQGPLLSLLAGRLGDRGQAEEVAHETFVRAFFRLPALREHHAFFPWLVGIARRIVQEVRRADRARAACTAAQQTLAAAGDAWSEPEGGHAAGTALAAERTTALDRAVAALPQRYREVILLRYYGGHSCQQVADLLRLQLGTVTKRLSRAHRLLREALPEPSE